MNFEDEHYVRIYTRDTKTWLKWGWEGQTVFMHIDRRFDKAGTLDGIDDPVDDVALLTGLPVEVVKIGLQKLLDSGTLELHSGRLVCPNYVAANSARKSDKLRAAESRARRSIEARIGVTKRDASSQSVTDESQNVTVRHGSSHAVTPRHDLSPSAVQFNADQRSAVQSSAGVAGEAAQPKKSRRKPNVPIPTSWEPLDRHRAMAAQAGVDCSLSAEKFMAHAESQDRRCADWNRAFDNWLLNERGRTVGHPRASNSGVAFDPFERARRLRAEEQREVGRQ